MAKKPVIAKSKSDTTKAAIPKLGSLDEVADAEFRIAEIVREISRHTTESESARQAITERSAEIIEPLYKQIVDIGKSIHAYAEWHREELTSGGKINTVQLPKNAGLIQWYRTPAAAEIANAEEVLRNIKLLGFTEFIRTKEEINKEALLENEDRAKTISGVVIARGEKFAIKPNGINERLERNEASKRWKLAIPKK